MSSGMNRKQAEEYAEGMTFRQAVSNVTTGKGIKYRKATMIKLRELADIADVLDRKDEPKTFERGKNGKIYIGCSLCIFNEDKTVCTNCVERSCFMLRPPKRREE